MVGDFELKLVRKYIEKNYQIWFTIAEKCDTIKRIEILPLI